MTAPRDAQITVRRRRVFYIPGFDPFPARRYRELYRSEGRAQAALSGYGLQHVAGDGATRRTGWTVEAQIEGQTTIAQIEVLGWSDIVHASMDRGVLATYIALCQTAWIYMRSGALFRLVRLRKGPVIAALYPVVMLVLQAFLAIGLGMGVASLWGMPAIAWPVVVLPVVWACLRLFQRWDRHVFAHYLMHDFAFAARWHGANGPELESRIAEFCAHVRSALDDDVDEVLVVGHSSGVHIAVSVLADVLRDGPAKRDAPALAFLSLGQVVPMMSFLPQATRLRRDLQALSLREDLTWVDVTAPGDGCAFALCDPVAVSGVASEGKRWPLVISAAFTQTLSPARWKTLRWRFFRLHFQYLCAFDQPGGYDYFQITAGPRTLADRFAGRAPSRSRIERAVNPHTSRAA